MKLKIEQERSRQIAHAIRSVRNLHQEIAMMFKETDRFLDNCGWKPSEFGLAHNHQYSKDNADYWMPWILSPTYRCETLPHLLSFLSVSLDSGDRPIDVEIPTVSVGVINYGMGNYAKDYDWHLVEVARWHSKDRSQFGTELQVLQNEITTNSFDAKGISYVRYPLVRISSRVFLLQSVLGKLETMIARNALDQ